ncbi:hypothetical protein [Bifidobacterium gallicum]|nr:hypothetical protein [Bifidobacterium gallicum]KFI59221.1 hypothetical protein BGLCM_0813 [Bifidobacterium gallicum DSM 20093 = LMG 11596]
MAAQPARKMRSHAAPAGRKDKEQTENASSRPELKLVVGSGATQTKTQGLKQSIADLWSWTKTKTSPMVHIIVAVVFLIGCLLGSLLLRTQMVQNSFDASEISQHITVLNQDVEEDQARLDELEASLPQKAQDLGMQPADGSITIDLNGYKPSHMEGQQ